MRHSAITTPAKARFFELRVRTWTEADAGSYLERVGTWVDCLIDRQHEINPAHWRFDLSVQNEEMKDVLTVAPYIAPKHLALLRALRKRITEAVRIDHEPCPHLVHSDLIQQTIELHQSIYGFLPGGVRSEAPAMMKFARPVVFERAGHRCQMCGSSKDLQVDHVIPVKQGGANYLVNFQALCSPCNQRKSKWLPHGLRGTRP